MPQKLLVPLSAVSMHAKACQPIIRDASLVPHGSRSRTWEWGHLLGHLALLSFAACTLLSEHFPQHGHAPCVLHIPAGAYT
jgi:hypothetical protein